MSTSSASSGRGYTSAKPVLDAIEALQDKIRAITPVTAFDKNRKSRIIAVLDATANLIRAECTGSYGYNDYYCFQFNSQGRFDDTNEVFYDD